MPEFRVPAIAFRQRDHELYCFAMPSDVLSGICHVTPRWVNNPREIQRILNVRRARDIGKYLRSPRALLPGAIVVSLDPRVKIRTTSRAQTRVLVFPDTVGKYAYVLDGQHRLEGFRHSANLVIDLAVVAVYNASEPIRARIFADINGKQVRVNSSHLLSLYHQLGELTERDRRIFEMIERLSRDGESVLRGRIRHLGTKQRLWITDTALQRLLAQYLRARGVASESPSDEARLLMAFFAAVAQTWPAAWTDATTSVLSRSAGIEVMLALLPGLSDDWRPGPNLKSDVRRFVRRLEPLHQAVDWRATDSDWLSTRASRRALIGRLNGILERS
jgi:DGQHR domain-containing protein